MTRCIQEQCPFWNGDGAACTCALFGVSLPSGADPEGFERIDVLKDVSGTLEGYWEAPDDRESEEDFSARVDAMNEEYPL